MAIRAGQNGAHSIRHHGKNLSAASNGLTAISLKYSITWNDPVSAGSSGFEASQFWIGVSQAKKKTVPSRTAPSRPGLLSFVHTVNGLCWNASGTRK